MSQGLRATSSSLRRALAALITAGCSTLATGCGQKIQEQYAVEIVGPIGVNYLKGATTVAVYVGGKELSRSNIGPGQPFSVTATGVNTTTTPSAIIAVRALDAMEHVVAYGQTLEI